jgi:peptidoglycan/LPS O-acetylase OafA/YrhL
MPRLGYVPALDGIRGIAILLVVGEHAFNVPQSGFLGVDLFFVLSGFLITTLLLDERTETGKVSLRSFYERRARRLLPALLMMLAVYAAVEFVQGRHPTLQILAGLFYFTDLASVLHFGWAVGPTTHLWSLAQEEQFYLLWPLLLIFLLRWKRNVAPWLIAALFVGVIVERILLGHFGASDGRALYSPDTRSDGLLVGCLLALWRHHWNGERLNKICRAVALGLAPFVALFVLGNWNTQILELGALPLVALYFGALVITAASPSGTPLGWSPLRRLGVISYALYIWHVPLLFAFGLHLNANDHPWRRLAVVTLAIAVAAVSTRYVEQPVRRRHQQGSRSGVPVAASAQAA